MSARAHVLLVPDTPTPRRAGRRRPSGMMIQAAVLQPRSQQGTAGRSSGLPRNPSSKLLTLPLTQAQPQARMGRSS